MELREEEEFRLEHVECKGPWDTKGEMSSDSWRCAPVAQGRV